jgi:GT2 family glycosyltransferase/glycosyltransferase involved in cell wall biosynthesis
MQKTRIIVRVGKRAIKKTAKGGFRSVYKGKSIVGIARISAKYGIKHGPKQLLKKAKQEIISVDRRLGSNLAFPNGLVTGVEPQQIKDWYEKHAKPVTLVIPSYNDMNVLKPCIDSLFQTTNPKYTHIIVVDDYCQPAHRKVLKKLESNRVEVIYREKNGGFAKAVNTGLRAANPKHDVVLVNSDIVAHADWLEGLQYGAYEFGVDAGIVGPKLLYPDGRIQSAGSYRNTEATEWFDHYYRFQDANYGPANIPHYCLAVTGACMYVKREFMNYVGILDDNFQFAKEDVDWCLRGWEAGYRTLYFPASTLTHVESATRAKNVTISDKQKQSVKYFWEKWGDWFDKRNVRDEHGRIRIIFVLQTLGLSGGIRIVFEHAERLAKRGFAVEVWGLDNHNPWWDLSTDIKLRTFKNYERMTTALSSEEAIKVATWWETAFPVWLASVKKGIPVYFIQEFETWFYPDDVVAQASVVSCYRKEFRNMTTSQYNLAEIKAIGLKATAIPCGYNQDTYKVLPKVQRQDNALLALGRSFFQKNFKFTFDGWKAMGEKRPDMWLYGFEPEMAKMDSKITYHTKPSNEEVNKLYNQATVFVQTSRHEGFSLPILEAMAAGCPVVCTDAHGNQDFCADGKNCLMVEHDDVAGLKNALERLFNDKKLRTKLSNAALKTTQNYTWEVITDKLEAFYKEVAKQ